MMKTLDELLRFARDCQRIDELKSISKSLNNIGVADCNYGDNPRRTKREERLVERAKLLAGELGFSIYYQTDPRGCSLYLITEDMRGHNYNSGMALVK